MKFADEFRDPAAARGLVKSITELAGDGEHKFMEVCGGHTHTIYRHGLEHLLPRSIELVHGPGCPVCVIPMGRVDDAIWLAGRPDVIFTTFGDMMRVPGSEGSLLEARARGCDVRFVYSPLDALKIAVDNPARQVVYFAVGFETTAPSTAVTLARARQLGTANFSVFCKHVTIVPPIKAIAAYAEFDAELRYSMPGLRVADPKARQCGEVLKGVIKPWECTVFGTACTPETPIGTCMVSPEWACAAYYNFGRLHRQTAALVGQHRAAVNG